MPDNYEQFDQSEDGATGQEKAGESDDKFRDRYRKSQAAIKKIRQQEQKKKKQDNTLAHIIVQFLNDPRFTRFFLLISRIVSKNVPSDILLAILSLIHRESAQAIGEKKLKLPEGEVLEEGENALFPPKIKAEITRWTQNILAVASSEPHRTLETLLDHNWDLDENVVELSIAVMQQFFIFQRIDVPPIDNLRGFFDGFYETLVGTLERQVHDQGALAGEVDEDFE